MKKQDFDFTVQNQIIADEGCVNVIYHDHLGNATVGIGHLITERDEEYGLEAGTPVDAARISTLFMSDFEQAKKDCIALHGFTTFNSLPDEVRSVLINMMFNLGYTKMSKFVKMNAAISSGDWREAAKEGRDSLWYNQVTNRAERLMVRLERV